jgi:hypothetical protein
MSDHFIAKDNDISSVVRSDGDRLTVPEQRHDRIHEILSTCRLCASSIRMMNIGNRYVEVQ